jgi:hypothetical protein
MSVVDGIESPSVNTGALIGQDEVLDKAEDLKYRMQLSQRRLGPEAVGGQLLRNGTCGNTTCPIAIL